MIKETRCNFCKNILKGRIDPRCKNHFCDKICMDKFRENKKYVELICEECKKKFKKRTKIYNQIKKKRDEFFCSSSCSAFYHYKKYIESCPNNSYLSRVLKTVFCEHCGKQLQQKPHQINSKKFIFCGNTCKNSYYQAYGYGGKIYGFNNCFFEGKIKTEEQAYVLGVIYADGTISSPPHRKHMRLSIQQRDERWLKKIAKLFGKENNISHRTRITLVNSLECKMCYFTLFGEKIWNDLYSKGIKPRKSKIDNSDILNYIPDYLLHHFIRGVFDGDGCIQDDKPTFQITGKKNILEDILIILCNKLKIKRKKIMFKENSSYNLVIGGRTQVLLVREWLYKNATIFLERKKNKFYNIKEKQYTSKYRGVLKRGKKWEAACCRKWLGSYGNEIEAAKAYDKELLKYNPPLYLLNFMEIKPTKENIKVFKSENK